jgi:hypothetical protein
MTPFATRCVIVDMIRVPADVVLFLLDADDDGGSETEIPMMMIMMIK